MVLYINGLIAIIFIGLLDYITGTIYSFSLFYLFPITFVTWFAGKRSGIFISIVCSILWIIADIMGKFPDFHPYAEIWNAIIRFGFFIIITYLLSGIRTINIELTNIKNILEQQIDARQKVEEKLQKSYDELEIRIAQRTSELKENQENFRQISENINVVFWITNVDKNRMLYINPAFEKIWGRTCESLYQRPKLWLEAIHPDDRDRVLTAATTQQISGTYSEEYRIIRPDGTIRWIWDRVFPIKDSFGQVYRLTGIAEDITEQKRSEIIARSLGNMQHRLGALSSVKEVARAVVDTADELFGWDACVMDLYSESSKKVRSIIVMDTVNGQKKEFPGTMNEITPSRLFQEILTDGPKLILRKPESHIFFDTTGNTQPFGDQSKPSASMMFVPIRKKNENIGILTIQSYKFNAYTEKDLILFQRLADLCSSALLRAYSESAQRETEERFRNIYEKSQIGIAIVDFNDRFLKANPKLCKMLGYTEAELSEMTFIEITHPEDRKKDLELKNKLLSGEIGKNSLEKRYIKKNKEIIWVNLSVSVVRDDDDNFLYGIGLNENITERKKAEFINHSLADMEYRLNTLRLPKEVAKTILKTADDIFGWDSCALDVYNESEQKVESIIVMDTVEGERKEFPPVFGGFMQSPIFQKVLREGAQLILRPKEFILQDYKNANHPSEDLMPFGNKTKLSASLMYAPIRQGNKNIGLMTIQSYSPYAYTKEDLKLFQQLADECSGALARAYAEIALQQTNQQLQIVSQRLLRVQEEERQHIARELHDEIGQSLTSLKLLLEINPKLSPEKKTESKELIFAQVNELIEKVRNLSMDLRPAILDDLGLLPTLAWHLKRFASQTEIQVHFTQKGLEHRFSQIIETCIYRIIQESLTNIARHAGVKEASVRIENNKESIYVEIMDMGKGFDKSLVLESSSSSGLSSMRDRAVLLGGTLNVQSSPGSGTTVKARIPLQNISSLNSK